MTSWISIGTIEPRSESALSIETQNHRLLVYLRLVWLQSDIWDSVAGIFPSSSNLRNI